MRKFYLFLIAIVFVFVACTDNNDVENSTLSETTICKADISSMSKNEIDALKFVALKGNTKIPVKEAVNLAMQTANEMRCEEGIPTKAPLKVKNIALIKNGVKEIYVKTKGDSVKKADLYIINFEDNQGYVLTSGDRRVPGVFAYNSTGNLGDTIYNPGEQVLLSRVEDYIELKKEEFKENRLKLIIAAQEELFKKLSKERQQELIEKGLFDENGKRIVTKFPDDENMDGLDDPCFGLPGNDDEDDDELADFEEAPDYPHGVEPWETIAYQPPLVKTLWNQLDPYNDALPDLSKIPFIGKCKDDDRCPVGCVAVAVGQIMGYHKKPHKIKGKVLHWDKMTEVKGDKMFSDIYDRDSMGRADIQYLLAILGCDDLIDIEYRCGGSSANYRDALRAFHKLGYTSARAREYDSNLIISEVTKGRPVYIRGASKKHHILFWVTYYDKGHAWVIDGYVHKRQKITVTEFEECTGEPYTYSYYNTLELVHNNFGWGGNLDGSSKDKYTATGWYHKGLYDTNKTPNKTSNTYKAGTKKNYQYDHKLIVYIN